MKLELKCQCCHYILLLIRARWLTVGTTAGNRRHTQMCRAFSKKYDRIGLENSIVRSVSTFRQNKDGLIEAHALSNYTQTKMAKACCM